jgi:DNA-binding NarL/FixJ family response regulator
MIRILVADDHPIMRKGLKQLFSETDNMAVISESATERIHRVHYRYK